MAKEFKQLLDQAINSTGPEPNWAVIMEMVEIIKRKDFPAKKASAEVRKKLLDTKETVILNALSVIEAIVKNTPGPIHQDFLSSDLLGSMKAIVVGQNTSMSRAIDKVLEVLGEWKAAFGEDNAYKGIITTFNELEKEGYYIPEANLASASFMKKPPEFEESNNCYLCSKEFGGRVYKGRHHCRNCGKSICNSCLHDNRLSLPHFGIDVPQKICISCSKKLDKTSESSGATPSANNETQRGTSPNPPPTGGNQKELELQEQEDIEMAIAISLNEQENKKKSSYSSPMSQSMVPTTTVPSAPPSKYTPIYADLDFSSKSSAPPTTTTTATIVGNAMYPSLKDDEFEKYSALGQKQREGITTAQPPVANTAPLPATTMNDQQQQDSQPLCNTLLQLIDQFTQRMQNIHEKGGSIATDRAVLSMHQDLTALHLQLLKQIDDTQEQKVIQERILHKVGEAKEARVTYDTMRRRHQEQLIQQEREQQALAQMQVQMKLALLRQQKAEQLAYGQTMQSERLNRLSNQRAEYEKSLATQRDFERQKLMTIEEQVFQQQFGNVPGNMPGNMPSNMAGNIPGNVPGNMPGNMAGNIPGNVPGNMPSSMAGNISSMPSNMSSNLPGNMPSNMAGNILGNVPGNMPSSMASNIPGNVPGNMPSSMAGNISSMASNVPGNMSSKMPVTMETPSYVAPPPTLYNGNQFAPTSDLYIPSKVDPPPYQSLAPPTMYQAPPLYQATPDSSMYIPQHYNMQSQAPPTQYMAPPTAPHGVQQPYTLPSHIEGPLSETPPLQEAYQRVPSVPPLISFD